MDIVSIIVGLVLGGGGGFAEGGENTLGGSGGGLALGGGREGVESEGVATGEQHAQIFKIRTSPSDGGEQFGHANTAIAVGIDQGEGFLVELKTLDWAGQRHPQLRVEGMEVFKISGGGQGDLVETADAKKIPGVVGHEWRAVGRRVVRQRFNWSKVTGRSGARAVRLQF